MYKCKQTRTHGFKLVRIMNKNRVSQKIEEKVQAYVPLIPELGVSKQLL